MSKNLLSNCMLFSVSRHVGIPCLIPKCKCSINVNKMCGMVFLDLGMALDIFE